MNHSNGISTES